VGGEASPPTADARVGVRRRLFGVEDGPTNVQVDAHRATVSNAQDAFLNGEFERCLAMCDEMAVRDERVRFDVALLRARALLRLSRAESAIEALQSCAFTPTSADGIVSARMLLGIAYAWLGQHERASENLTRASQSGTEAHPTIRAELLLNCGIARYLAGDLEAADKLLASVASDADMISARALEYRGWIAFLRGTFDAASVWFRAAQRSIRSCRWRDRFVEASVLQGLSTLTAEMMTTAEWPELDRHIRAFDWNAGGLAKPAFWVSFYAGIIAELRGDHTEACERARETERRAPNEAYRAIALCRTASIFRALGERKAHLEFALRASDGFRAIEPRLLGPDQQQLPLFIAEELAYAGAIPESERLVTQYRELLALGPHLLAVDDRFIALETVVEGSLAESRRERTIAVQRYAKALRLFRKAGYRRRAVAIAIRLARLTGSRRYVDYASAALRDVHEDYWVAREVAALRSDEAPALTTHQRTILVLVAQGKTYKEIGTSLGRSWKTIANSVELLRTKFGAGTRGELVAAAARHGVVDLGKAEIGRTA
jgi:DNA-binding CsgD family transcriptional regulator